MKARHIKKLRKEIKHYYIVNYDSFMFGFNYPCSPSYIKKNGHLVYGRNEADAIKRYTHISNGFYYTESDWMFATWVAIPVDAINPKFITYWR